MRPIVLAAACLAFATLLTAAPMGWPMPRTAAAQEVTPRYLPAVLFREGNFRADPSTKQAPLGTYPAGTQVLILGETWDAQSRLWYKISLYDGQQGFMFGNLLRPLPRFPAPPKGLGATVATDAAEKALLVGGHELTLHWIGWDQKGEAVAFEDLGLIYLQGSQQGTGAAAGDRLDIAGFIWSVEKNQFVFEGRIAYRVASLTGTSTCTRQGVFTFARATGKKYWRLQETKSPCRGQHVDYVDLYLRDE